MPECLIWLSKLYKLVHIVQKTYFSHLHVHGANTDDDFDFMTADVNSAIPLPHGHELNVMPHTKESDLCQVFFKTALF